MEYKEFEQRLKDGTLSLDDIYWIVDYRFNDINNQAIRSVPPTMVNVFNMSATPPKKRVYYAEHYFRPVGQNGKILAKEIAPFDNTGYRGYTGLGVHVFLLEEDAIEFYKNQCETAINQIHEARDASQRRFDTLEASIKEIMNAHVNKI